MNLIEVVCGVVTNSENRILITQRGDKTNKYKWEFPGGKIEAGETREEALVRELQEELKITVGSLEYLTTVDHKYPDFKLIMHGYTCRIVDSSSPELTEHLDSCWLFSNELKELDWAAADIPIVDLLV